FADALKDLRRALESAPKDGELYFVLGNLQAGQGRTKEAIEAFTIAVRLSPKLHNAFYNRGVLLRREKRLDEAESHQNSALNLTPNSPAALRERALCGALRRQWQAALADLDVAVALAPKDPLYLVTRGQVWGSVGTTEGLKMSETDLTRALEMDPSNLD